MSATIDGSDEVLSGEAVAIGAQPLGFLLRSLGALIDLVLGYAVFLLWLFLRAWLTNAGVLTEATDRTATIAATVTSFLVLPITIEMLTRGRSLGKLAVGGRIVRLDGGATGFRHAFIRGLLGVAEIYLTFGGLAVISGALTARSQRLGDLVAGTYSQRVRTPALAVNAPSMPPELAGWAQVADVARLPDRLVRRISQFLAHATQRLRVAEELLSEAAPYIAPLPVGAPERILVAVTVIRRERERRALVASDERAERLTGRRIRV